MNVIDLLEKYPIRKTRVRDTFTVIYTNVAIFSFNNGLPFTIGCRNRTWHKDVKSFDKLYVSYDEIIYHIEAISHEYN